MTRADTKRSQEHPAPAGQVRLFLAGDVMTGRGIDQILPYPCQPALHEDYLTSAADYVALAEQVNGAIPRRAGFAYVWGDALAELERRCPQARLINLETAVTTSADWEPKGINYRMNPQNAPVLTAARIDCCSLANNHVLDWGEQGLLETLKTLGQAGLAVAGAGLDSAEAQRPAVLTVPGGRVVLIALGAPSSGIPGRWAAGDERPGVNYLPRLNAEAVGQIARQLHEMRKPGDVAVVSLHWGGNWGYGITDEERDFAHSLIDEAGVDIVWGHSSHHPKAIKVHNGKLVLFGCGDVLNDYEGIRGHAAFRGDLALMYFPTLRLSDGRLQALAMVPLQIRNFRLHQASPEDAAWLCAVLDREAGKYGAHVRLGADNTLMLDGDGLSP